jgi:hypothetical protein
MSPVLAAVIFRVMKPSKLRSSDCSNSPEKYEWDGASQLGSPTLPSAMYPLKMLTFVPSCVNAPVNCSHPADSFFAFGNLPCGCSGPKTNHEMCTRESLILVTGFITTFTKFFGIVIFAGLCKRYSP